MLSAQYLLPQNRKSSARSPSACLRRATRSCCRVGSRWVAACGRRVYMDRRVGCFFAVFLVCLAMFAGGLGQSRAYYSTGVATSPITGSGGDNWGNIGKYTFADWHDQASVGIKCESVGSSV